MPSNRPLVSPLDLQEEAQQQEALLRRRNEIDEELTLYHPDGPWRFMQERLDRMENYEKDLLMTCEITEVQLHRERLKLIRHLANLREGLMKERAEIEEKLNG